MTTRAATSTTSPLLRPALLLVVVALLVLISTCVVYASESPQGGDDSDHAPPVPPLAVDDDDEDLDDFGDDDDVDLHMAYTTEDDLSEDEEALIAAGLRGITSHPDVHPSALFPHREDQSSLVLGETTDMLLGFKNTGDMKFTVAAIRGYIVNPPDWTFPIQNLTGFGYNVSVMPEETSTLFYRFLPSERLAPREFGVVVEVFYTSERNTTFMTTFFNQTVLFVEPDEEFGVQSLISIFTLLGLVLGGAYIAFYFYAPKSLKDSVDAQLASVGIGKSRSAASVSPTRTSDPNVVDEEWIPAHLRNRLQKNKGGKKKGKK